MRYTWQVMRLMKREYEWVTPIPEKTFSSSKRVLEYLGLARDPDCKLTHKLYRNYRDGQRGCLIRIINVL